MTIRRALLVFAASALLAAACASDDPATETADAASETTTTGAPATTTIAAPTTTTTVAPEQTTTAAPADDGEWVAHEAPDDCMCADGSDYWIQSRTADPEKVMLYFQGGGACFTEAMCQFEDGTYKVTTGPDDHPAATGIFDFDDPENPFADWSVVHVPYCTGDVHIGDATTTYGDLTIEHNGFVNASFGLDFLTEQFPDATHVFVTGSSAGGVPAPLFGAFAADAYPEADVAALSDASGGYASNPPTNEFIGDLWDTFTNVPEWPELEGITAAEWGIPDLFRFAGQHAPDLRLARYDNAWDEVQVSFSAMAGLDGGLLEVLEVNEANTEAAGVDLPVYVAPGYTHTILQRPELYDLEVEGVAFVDWLSDFVAGTDPGDVKCTECGPTERPADDGAA
jgi:hypothetical protein